jgi:hypothetical protein
MKKKILIPLTILLFLVIISMLVEFLFQCVGLQIGHRNRFTGKCSTKHYNLCNYNLWVGLFYEIDSDCTFWLQSN